MKKSTRFAPRILLAFVLVFFWIVEANSLPDNSKIIDDTNFIYLPLVQNNSFLIFKDEFLEPKLSSDWIEVKGSPYIDEGKLILIDSEVQSVAEYSEGVLIINIKSPDFKNITDPVFTDGSVAVEIWNGLNNSCHYGIGFKPNGHVFILKSQPNGNNDCSQQSAGIADRLPGDPKYQEFYSIENWDSFVESNLDTVSVRITWNNQETTIYISDGTYIDQTISSNLKIDVPMKIRLNTAWDEPHESETFEICSVEVYQPPTDN